MKRISKIGVFVITCFLLQLGIISVGAAMGAAVDLSEYESEQQNESENLEELRFPMMKNPQISNPNMGEVLAFMTVTVPVKEVTLIAQDGTMGDKSVTEFFCFQDTDDSVVSDENSWNIDWVELRKQERELSVQGDFHTYVFAYKKRLGNGEEAPPLFERVQLRNIAEQEEAVGQAQNILVKVFLVPIAGIEKCGDAELMETMSEANISRIYEKYIGD